MVTGETDAEQGFNSEGAGMKVCQKQAIHKFRYMKEAREAIRGPAICFFQQNSINTA